MVQLYGGAGSARTPKVAGKAVAAKEASFTVFGNGEAAREDEVVVEGQSATESEEETPLLPELTQKRSLMASSVASESSQTQKAAKKRQQVRKRANASKVRFADSVEQLDRQGPRAAVGSAETSDSEECRDDDMECSSSSGSGNGSDPLEDGRWFKEEQRAGGRGRRNNAAGPLSRSFKMESNAAVAPGELTGGQKKLMNETADGGFLRNI